jgi:hypothetical protein
MGRTLGTRHAGTRGPSGVVRAFGRGTTPTAAVVSASAAPREADFHRVSRLPASPSRAHRGLPARRLGHAPHGSSVCEKPRGSGIHKRTDTVGIRWIKGDRRPSNFSYRLSRDRRWELAPAYDLTFNEGPNGEHQMAVHGLGKSIPRSALLDLAESAQLDPKWAAARIDAMLLVAAEVPALLADQPVRLPTRRHIASALAVNSELLA